MKNVHLPDTVIGLGGSGKRLVFETLTQQSGDGDYWFLEELMAERNRDLNRVNFFTIDSATKEATGDRSRVEEINDAITDIETQNRKHDVSEYADVNHEYLNIGTDISRVYQTRDQFVNINSVEEWLGQTDLTHWWLRKEDLRSGLDFSEGVYRRRARSKGMYYAAKHGGRKIDQVTAAAGSEVALITALGGGTGSGMFLDLAREIDADGVSVTLFAVLPNTEEDPEKRANAHAALSELEYLQLTDQNPFAQIVLLPFEPAADGSDPKAYADEFMDAFPYTLLSFYNADNNIRHTAFECENAGYHPFTIAAPQVIRYNTAHLDRSRSEIAELLDDKAELLEREIELYDALETYLIENYDAVEEFTAELEDELTAVPEETVVGPLGQNILQRRFDDFETLTSLDTFEQLSCDAPAKYQPLIDEATNGEGTIVDTIRELERRRQLNPHEEITGGLDIDPQLDDVLDREIDALIAKARVMELSERTDDPTVRDHLVRDLNRSPETKEAEGHERLEAERKDARNERDRLADELEAVEELIEETIDAIDSAVDRLDPRISGQLRQLRLIDEHETELLDAAAAVGEELRRIRTQINRETDPDDVERISFDGDTSAFDVLEDVGIDQPPDISRTVDYLTKGRAEALRNDADGGILDGVTDWMNGGDEERQSQYEGYVRSLRKQSSEGYGQVASLPRWDRRDDNVRFELDLRETIEEHLSDRRTELLGELANEYENLVEQLRTDEELAEEVHDSLDDAPASLGAVRSMVNHDDPVPERMVEVLIGESLVEPRARRDELRGSVEEAERREARFRNAVQFYYEHNDLTGYTDDEAELRERLKEVGIDRNVGGGDDDYRYIKRVDPIEVDQLLEVQDLRSEGFWQKERNQIRSRVEDDLVGTNLCQSHQYFRLRAVGSELGSPDQTSRQNGYTGHMVSPVFMSRLFEDNRSVDFDVRREFEGEGYGFNLNAGQRQQYEESIVQNGGPWDIAVTVFVGGVFLDNLREMQSGSKSLPSGYEHQERNEDIRLHHSWGLGGEDRSGVGAARSGLYARRTDVMSLAARQADDPSVVLDEPAVLFLNDASDEEIGQTILDRFYDVQTFTTDHPYNTSTTDE